MDCITEPQIISFTAGFLSSLFGFMIASCILYTNPEPPPDTKNLFRKLPLLPPESDDEEDIQEYLADRLSTSQAFRLKMVRAMAKLHNEHPTIYAQVMKKQ